MLSNKIEEINLHKLIINNLIIDGKRKKAVNIFINTLFIIKKYMLNNKSKLEFKDPMILVSHSIENIRPAASLSGRIIAGRLYQIPVILDDNKSLQLGIKSLIKIVRRRLKSSNEDMSIELAKEIINSFEGRSETLSEKERLEIDVLYNRPNLRFI